MIKDALNFFRLRTQDIEHYDRYRISSILLVLVFILLGLRTLVGYAQNCQIDSFTCIFSLSSNDQITIVEIDEIFGIFSYNLVSSVGILLAYLFFTYWVFRKVKKHPFILLYKFFGIMVIGIIIGIYSTIFIPLLMSILADHLYYSYEIHILGSPIDILIDSLINYPLYFFRIFLSLYVFYMVTITTSKAMGVSKLYAISGMALAILVPIFSFCAFIILMTAMYPMY